MKADGAEEETNVKPIWISSKYCFRLLCEFDEVKMITYEGCSK